MNVNAIGLVRKMRGGAQAHLLECDDGHFYVVKFQNNSQHLRTLVNEWLASSLFGCLQVSTPVIAIVHVSAEFLAYFPEVHIQLTTKHIPVEPGVHFGSRYQGSPDKTMVYDFLPDSLLTTVSNLSDFLGAFVLDKWTGNTDARQAIFSRPSLPPGSEKARGFRATMIDQGHAFGGQEWSFPDGPLQGVYFRSVVYRNVQCCDDFQPWLDQVVLFPEAALDNARSQLPAEWILGEEASLDVLVKKLLSRRKRVPDLIADSARVAGNAFPEWRQPQGRPQKLFCPLVRGSS